METLSDKISDYDWDAVNHGECITADNVKEFIRELKEIYANCDYDDFDRTFAIDKLRELAGDKLI